MASIDPKLLDRTKSLDLQFSHAISNLANNSTLDLRIFFTITHRYITGKIARHIELFASPNALMRLNDSFATAYLKALNGRPHDGWKKAFQICRAESDAVMSGFRGLVFVGPTAAEACAGCMASVHIRRDLRDALLKVSDVDAQDYGNVLIFIEEANLRAEIELRGRALGTMAFVITHMFPKKLNLDVKEWRNKVFEDCYHKQVPDPSHAFAVAYHRREGR